MNQHRAERDLLPALLAALLGMSLSFSAWAQEQDEASSSEPAGPIEELTVVAPKALETMRQELVVAENDVLNVYNALNEDDDYDIYCTEERPLGSYIPVRVCRARFVDNEQAQSAYDLLSGAGFTDPSGQISYHEDIMRTKMAELAAENPNLYNALLQYYNLKTDYDTERASRFEDQFFAR
ncbi:MAG: hypothetical protein ACR2QQ_08005 [Gammaproteobacteria bacterium]